ncbi:adenine deaminase [Emticicia sp. CRIBPO]|uniref:adenine deaminase n=1 Tax=Emticicia sp. CRIBPO TaxID=2683258 RepID=UPI001411C65C|nr:adenine deaminase [Emticicia sp. CRIBPO]NBA86257.1 adenine deaminase [Emticicia sp. CRIBPO]
METIQSNIVNIFDNTIYFGELVINQGRIFQIKRLGESRPDTPFLVPGFVDAHVHIESSMLTPSQFGRLAVTHGTIATVSDPHEIANVLGVEGVKYMIEDGKRIPFKFCFGAPSCVPATTFETAGAIIDSQGINELLQLSDVGYLAEMMNFPGAIHGDEEVLKKIDFAERYNKPVDGHAPGLRGEEAVKYFQRNITTDHECFEYEEAKEKLELGVKILIREGSAAKNFDDLIPLAGSYANQMMFCSDDKHPDDLVAGHINKLVSRAVKGGLNVFKALRMASLNPVRHYNLDMGLVREGEPADFVLVNNLEDFQVVSTYIDGVKVAEKGISLLPNLESPVINNFKAQKIKPQDLIVRMPEGTTNIKVIKALNGQLVTRSFVHLPIMVNRIVEIDDTLDILKLVVYNRYENKPPAVAFIQGFGLTEGAIASSVAHDSHNIIAVGVDDVAIADAINLVIRENGGVSAVSNQKMGVLPLPIAGLMSNKDAYQVAEDYTQIDKFSKEVLGSRLKSPFMSLSFMALLVIPSLKLSDQGLFDGNTFSFTDMFEYPETTLKKEI